MADEQGARRGDGVAGMGSGGDGPRDTGRERGGKPRPTPEVVRSLHAQGLPDLEIAERLDVDVETVFILRESLALVPNIRTPGGRPRRSAVEGRDAAYQAAYEQGLIDADIARKVGVSRAAVWVWRQGRKLPPNRGNKPTSDDCWKWYIRGKDDQEIAALTGLSAATVTHWRYRYDLPAISRLVPLADGGASARGELPDYQKYYDMGWNDAEIAAVTNRTPAAVQTWRRKHGFGPNIVGRPNRAEETHLPPEVRPRRPLPPLPTREQTGRRDRVRRASPEEQGREDERPPRCG
jgi:DNA-binding CsgD family transcriptional regulator